MRVAVMGVGQWDGEGWPVAIVLSEKDRENIANMAPGDTVYSVFPDSVDGKRDILPWLVGLKGE